MKTACLGQTPCALGAVTVMGLSLALSALAVETHAAVSESTPPDFSAKVFTLVTEAPTPAPTTSTGEHESTDAGELAKKLSNPISSLISVPFQSNFDFNQGPDNNKFQYTLNIQPVIPVSISKDWNLITRIILPIINQESLAPGLSSNFGLGDTQTQFFFSPKEPWHRWIWGVGPIFLLPTATDTALGSGKWGAGPNAVALRQEGPWTYGVLANHIWSFAGDDDRPSVNNTFIQPFLAYNTPHGTGVTLQAESTYNWNAGQWTIPVGLYGSQVLKIGGLPISFQFGPRVYVEGPSGGPEWGLRFNMIFLFPK